MICLRGDHLWAGRVPRVGHEMTESANQLSSLVFSPEPHYFLSLPNQIPCTTMKTESQSLMLPSNLHPLGFQMNETFSSLYLDLISQPLKCIKSRFRSDDQNPKDELKAQAPKHCPPAHLGSKRKYSSMSPKPYSATA